jgi:hypothetical protein
MGLRDFRTAAANDEQGDAVAREIMRGERAARWPARSTTSCSRSATATRSHAAGRGAPDVPRSRPRTRGGHHRDDPLTGEPWPGSRCSATTGTPPTGVRLLPGTRRRRAIKRAGATRSRPTPFRFERARAGSGTRHGTNGSPDPEPCSRSSGSQNERGVGEFEEHLDHLDRINDKIFNEWWISKIQAFRQRAVKNLPDTGRVDDRRRDRLHRHVHRVPGRDVAGPGDVEFWESTRSTSAPIVNSIQKDLERLAAARQQPLHTITPDAANGSAEGASLMREEHLFKIEDRIER